MKVSLVSVTKQIGALEKLSPEELIVYCARASSPENQANTETAPKLLRYLIKNNHWSPFEMASMCVEIQTSRAISRQILRHKSFSFQEFSQRYAAVTSFERFEARTQDVKNRQNSFPANKDLVDVFDAMQDEINNAALRMYKRALASGIAKEQARVLLPESALTVLYMQGSARSWYHYLAVRLLDSAGKTQKEHRDIAYAIFEVFREQFPVTAETLIADCEPLHPL